jgi:hypothetical protein
MKMMTTKVSSVFFMLIFALNVNADADFPFPEHEAQCSQTDQAGGGGLKFSREIRILFNDISSAEVMIGLGMGGSLPRTVCWQEKMSEIIAQGPSVYKINGDMLCLDSRPEGYRTQPKTIHFYLDTSRMILSADSFIYNCEWRKNTSKDK